MNERLKKVLLLLKPKSKALGFNKRELQGIAATIADNLTSAEDASDEDVNEEIEKVIESVLPYLSFGQSQANRILDEWKKNHPSETDVDDDENDNESINTSRKNIKPGKKKDNQQNNGEETPEWAKGMLQTIETLTGKLAALEGEKISNTRKSKLEALLKGSGTFGTRTLKSFGKMKFENDDDFEDFYSEVEEDLKAYQQERADAGLQTMVTPPGAGKNNKNNEPYSDKEIEAMADNF